MNLEFALILVGPWLLDLVGGRGVLASIFGALLWGAAVVVAFARRQSKESRFQTKLGFLLATLSGSWLTYWILCFLGPAPIYFESRGLKWLTLLHAGILAAGLGMVLILALASLLWLGQDFFLKKNSWQRRQSSFFKKLPPLEALARVAHGSMQWAFSSWGFGLLLAFLATFMRWKLGKESEISHSLDWMLDTRIFLTALLWLLLSLGQQLSLRLSAGSPWLYRAYLAVAFLFLVLFNALLPGHGRAFHEPINWFVR